MMPLERRQRLTVASSTILMMFALICGKLFGQLREILIAPQIGIGAISDGYIIGFQIPDLLYELLIGGAIQAAITPTLAGAIENHTQRDGWRSVSIFLNAAAAVMLVFVVLGQFLSPILIPAFYSGRSQETIDVAVRVARTLFPQVLFMMLAALCIGILNAYRRFERTAFGPVFYNAGVVLSMILLGDRTANGTVRVAAGVMLSACLFFLFQFYLARDVFRKHYVFSLNVKDPGFRRLLRLAIPTMLAASIAQVNVMVLTAFINRSFQQDGLVTALRYASTTWQLPYGILAVAIGNVMLPSLSAHAHAGQDVRFRRMFGNGLRNALILVVPSATLIFAMRQDVVRAIFQWGPSLQEPMIATTSSILVFYCFSIVVQTLIFLFSIASFSVGNTKVPLIGGAVSLVSNLFFCLAFTSIPGAGPSVMSLSYLLSGICSATVVLMVFRKLYARFFPRSVGIRYAVQLLLCAAASFLAVSAMGTFDILSEGKFQQLAWLAIRGITGFAVFYLAARSLRIPEAEAMELRLLALTGKIFGKNRPGGSGQDGQKPE